MGMEALYVSPDITVSPIRRPPRTVTASASTSYGSSQILRRQLRKAVGGGTAMITARDLALRLDLNKHPRFMAWSLPILRLRRQRVQRARGPRRTSTALLRQRV